MNDTISIAYANNIETGISIIFAFTLIIFKIILLGCD